MASNPINLATQPVRSMCAFRQMARESKRAPKINWYASVLCVRRQMPLIRKCVWNIYWMCDTSRKSVTVASHIPTWKINELNTPWARLRTHLPYKANQNNVVFPFGKSPVAADVYTGNIKLLIYLERRAALFNFKLHNSCLFFLSFRPLCRYTPARFIFAAV